jgi:SRSO17 transposase
MPTGRCRFIRIARDCCCRVIAKALRGWQRACSQAGTGGAPVVAPLRGKSDWSDDAVLTAARARVLPLIARRGPIRALIIDDTGMPKKGRHSVGVARQYCEHLGK